MIEAYFDGCCEPKNPGGTASFGAVIFKEGKKIWECSKIYKPDPRNPQETSNNLAEYKGFIAILTYLLAQNWDNQKVVIRGDSKLVINQMFGDPNLNGKFWKIRKGIYVPYAIDAKKLLKNFSNIQGYWIPRDNNDIADKLSKAELLKAGVKFKIQSGENKSI